MQIIKSITAKEIFKRCSEVKEQLWGGKFWSSGCFISTVGKHGDEDVSAHYVKKQGRKDEYKRLHRQKLGDHPDQLIFWEDWIPRSLLRGASLSNTQLIFALPQNQAEDFS